MTVRKVTADEDFRAIAEIYADSWRAAYRGIVPDSCLDTLTGERWSSVIEGRMLDAFVLMDGEKYAGISTYCGSREPEMAGWGELVSIYLRPEYMGHGLGDGLFRASMGALRALGFQSVFLWALEANARARAFYERRGFAWNGDTNIITIDGVDIPEVRYVCRFDEQAAVRHALGAV